MAQIAKSKIEVEIKASADKFFETLKATSSSVPNISPKKILDVEVQDREGHVKYWTLAVDGKVEKMKERVEVDDENMSITYNVFDGDVMEHYRNFKCNLQIIPKPHGSIARWTWEYEKLYEGSPAPNKYMDFAVNLTRDVEANLVKT